MANDETIDEARRDSRRAEVEHLRRELVDAKAELAALQAESAAAKASRTEARVRAPMEGLRDLTLQDPFEWAPARPTQIRARRGHPISCIVGLLVAGALVVAGIYTLAMFARAFVG